MLALQSTCTAEHFSHHVEKLKLRFSMHVSCVLRTQNYCVISNKWGLLILILFFECCYFHMQHMTLASNRNMFIVILLVASAQLVLYCRAALGPQQVSQSWYNAIKVNAFKPFKNSGPDLFPGIVRIKSRVICSYYRMSSVITTHIYSDVSRSVLFETAFTLHVFGSVTWHKWDFWGPQKISQKGCKTILNPEEMGKNPEVSRSYEENQHHSNVWDTSEYVQKGNLDILTQTHTH